MRRSKATLWFTTGRVRGCFLRTGSLLLLLTTLAQTQVLYEAGHADTLEGVVLSPASWANGAVLPDKWGNLYVTGGDTSNIWRKTPNGSFNVLAILPMGDWGQGLALDGDTLYVGARNTGRIYEVDISAAIPVPQLVATVPGSAFGLCLGCAGMNLIVSTESGIHEVDLATAAVSELTSSGEYPAVACHANDDRLLLADHAVDAIQEVTPLGVTTQFSSLDGTGTDGIAVHPLTGDIYVASSWNDLLERVDPTGSTRMTFGSNMDFSDGTAPTPLRFSPLGDKLYYGIREAGDYVVHSVDGFPEIIYGKITAPNDGATVSWDVNIIFEGSSSFGRDLVATFEYSTDGGATFDLCSTSWKSPMTNPSPPFSSAIVGQSYVWDSLNDIGTGMLAQLRLSLEDDTAIFYGLIGVDVDNAWPSVSCMAESKDSVAGPIPLEFDVDASGYGTYDLEVQYSTDGATWTAATGHAKSEYPNPIIGVSESTQVIEFIWNSLDDGVGLVAEQSANIRAVVQGAGAPGDRSCISTAFPVDNGAACLGLCGDCDGDGFRSILDALRIARVAAGLLPEPKYGSSEFNRCNVSGLAFPDPDAVIGIMDALRQSQFIVGLSSLNCCQ